MGRAIIVEATLFITLFDLEILTVSQSSPITDCRRGAIHDVSTQCMYFCNDLFENVDVFLVKLH